MKQLTRVSARRPRARAARRRAAARAPRRWSATSCPTSPAPHGYVVDKVEGFAIDAAGNAYAVTDNDGVDDSSGETHFLPLGPLEAM